MPVTSHQALVTGGTKGIGRAVVSRLAREGHAVVAVYRNDEGAREEAAREFAEAHLKVGFERVDLSQATQVADLFHRLAERGRSPEILVNAAGLNRDAPIAFLGETDFDAVLDANLRATFLTCQQAVKAMARRRYGRIINFASPAALLGHEGQAAYSAAKAGVLGLTRTLAREVGRLGITVNAVSPGIVRTEMTAQLSEQQVAALIRRTPLQRAGTADEVAGMVNMLCDDGAGYITGQCLSIDGGLS
jgi:3-oxoacyl-[acyl-carrier protein] reductase